MTWASLHCHLLWKPPAVDAFLRSVVAPMLDGLVEDWFYVRYSEGGPHLRIRLRGADPTAVREVAKRLADAVAIGGPPDIAGRDGWAAHGEVRPVAYEPETERYGGPVALPVAEDVFCGSTRIALAVLASTPDRGRRLALSVDLVLATAIALDLDELGTVRWLRGGAMAWRWHRGTDTLIPPMVQGPAQAAAAGKSAAVMRRWRDLTAPDDGSSVSPAGRWLALVRSARARLKAAGGNRHGWYAVWSSQLHMLLNRIGVRPEEELALTWFVSTSLLAPDGPADFFADRTTAPDRGYLQASSYAFNRMDNQQPRDTPRPAAAPRHNPLAGKPLPLRARPAPSVPLETALANRKCARDGFGPLDAGGLGTLLWTASTGEPHRPFPSAGAQYVARLRLIARDVDGLAPGSYEADPDGRRLLPLGTPPAVDELKAASMWFDATAPPIGRVDVATLPALLGLYVELGAMRARYGLRALRFALLEAGHLAQCLSLVAAAHGLTIGLLGGFYDDVAHELFMLDGVDDVLVYLIPVGGPVR